MPKVDNAVIMAAGTSSRFAPLSYEMPKALLEVKGEILIERQICQLRQAGIPAIYIVTGYKAEQFGYLRDKYGVQLIHNPDYLTRNNHSSIWAVREILGNTYVCSADNYFSRNPFTPEVDEAYYAAVYADGYTDEWCMQEDAQGYISSVTIGGEKAWYMLGHTFWDERFSGGFLSILEKEYDLPETADKLWEKIFMAHLDTLKMKIRRYPADEIFEFDTLDELRLFDKSYQTDSRSAIMRAAAEKLHVAEGDIVNVRSMRGATTMAAGFSFDCRGEHYQCLYENGAISPVPKNG